MERENDKRTSAQRYMDILTEAGFKAVFGVEKNKDVLIDLLNTGVPRFTPEEKLKYEHDMMTERDYTNILNTYRDEALAEGLAEGEVKGRLEGKAEGMAEGLAEGEARGKMEVARAMKAKGIEIALISELTGLSEEKIRQS